MEQIMVDVGHKRIFAEVEFAHEMWIAVITEHFTGIILFCEKNWFIQLRPVESNTEHPVLSESSDKQINVSATSLSILGQRPLL